MNNLKVAIVGAGIQGISNCIQKERYILKQRLITFTNVKLNEYDTDPYFL